MSDIKSRGFDTLIADTVKDFVHKADEVSVPSWPEFMLHDPVSDKYWVAMHEKYAAFQFCLVERSSGRWAAIGNSIPIHWSDSIENLPDGGWDWGLKTGMENESANMVCALAIQIHPDFRGKGLSTPMVKVMNAIVANHGYSHLVAPVRPNRKQNFPDMPMQDYIALRENGLPVDPWLRVHERLGAKTIKICTRAMEITGTVKAWQEWTGMKFSRSGAYAVSGALVPVNIDVEKDIGVYVEPNVWMIHETSKK